MTTYLMNPYTGTIQTEEEWKEEYEAAKAAGFPDSLCWNEGDLDLLSEVVPNIPGEPGYDPDYDEWRDA